MKGDMPTLLDAIEHHPEQPLLLCGDERLTPSALVAAAEATRRCHPELAGVSVALQFSDTAGLLLNLLALDGFAGRMLLLPPCLSGAALEQVLAAAGVSRLMSERGVSVLRPVGEQDAAPDATEWLFTTSGTTGPPKVFSHTLRSLAATARTGSSSSREYTWGLAYRAYRFAGIQVFLQALLSGSALVVPAGNDTASMAGSFVTHGVNTLSATPSQWRNFLIHGAIRDCPLVQITLGGEIADQAILSTLRREFPAARIVHIYASTEAGVGFSVTDGLAGFPAAWLQEGAPVDIRISDTGSLLIRARTISNSQSLRSRLTSDGYLDTQDSVQIDNDRVHFLGRASGIINVGGNKVHPEEIENIVREVPGVQNALVSAKNSPIMGQLVVLDVQSGALSTDEATALKRRIREHCRQHLAKFKVPAMINIVGELAVSESGKVDRKQTG